MMPSLLQAQSLLRGKLRVSVVLLWLIVVVIVSGALFPLVSFAQNTGVPLVPTCNTTISNGRFTVPCGWTHLVQLGQNILNFMIYIAVPIAAILFAYAGWLYLSARGNPGQISRAHSIFLNVAIGIVIVLVAWLVVDQIMKALVKPGSYIPILNATTP